MKLATISESITGAYREALGYASNARKADQIVRAAGGISKALTNDRAWWDGMHSCWDIEVPVLNEISRNVKREFAWEYTKDSRAFDDNRKKGFLRKAMSFGLHAATGTPLTRDHMPERLKNLVYPTDQNRGNRADKMGLEATNKIMATVFVIMCGLYKKTGGSSGTKITHQLRKHIGA